MDIEVLKNRVYTTRKSRINTSERLIKKEKFIQGINIYYSCVLIAVSIFGLNNQSYMMSLLSVIASISLTMSLLYISNQRYSERAQELKNNYICLQELYFKLEELNNETKDLSAFEQQYIELLHSSENHSEMDYIKAQMTLKKASWKEKCKYYFITFLLLLIKLLIIVAPIIFILLTIRFINT